MTVPAYLIERAQWMVWKKAQKEDGTFTKVPYSPHTLQPASITDRANFGTYAQVSNGILQNFDGYGFCLTKEDDAGVIDLDSPYKNAGDTDPESVRRSHENIIAYMNSYTDISPSQTGAHVWFIGKLPDEWRKRVGKVEIYTHSRFMTVTGNHWAGTPTTIEHRQNEVEEICRQLGLDKPYKGDDYESKAEYRSDEDTIRAIRVSRVGDRFIKVWEGDLTGFPSGSEADQALANYITFATDNREQAARIFRASPHYAARAKLHTRDDLVLRVISNGFDQKPPLVNVSALRKTTAAVAAEPTQEDGPDLPPLTLPEGALGVIADYIWRSAPQPLPEAALAGAIGLMGGLAGRAFNTYTGAGLNQYVVMIAHSGFGKEAIPKGIAKLLKELATVGGLQSIMSFLGPQHIASDRALYKCFGKEKDQSLSIISVIPEFGRWLQRHTSQRASNVEMALLSALMDMWQKADQGAVAGGTVYSDREKNVVATESPSFSFVGDTVPDSFYASITPDTIVNGLVPRMFIMQYRGKIPQLNEFAAFHRMTDDERNYLASFAYTCMHNNAQNIVTRVPLTDDARDMFKEFDKECRRHREAALQGANADEATNAIWNRSHLKALKLASLIGVGKNWQNPEVTHSQAAWAIDLARRDVTTLLSKIGAGEISSGSQGSDRHAKIIDYFKTYIKGISPSEQRKIPEEMHKKGIMPLSWLINRAKNNKLFRDENGRTTQDLVVKALKELTDHGVIREVVATDPLILNLVSVGSTARYFAMVSM